jgi:hypothetical protein
MSEVMLSIIGRPTIIQALSQQDVANEVKLSKPVPLTGPSDVLDAPLNPDDTKTDLEISQAIFETLAAARAFFNHLSSLLQSYPEDKVQLQSATTGQPLGTVDHTTSLRDIERMLG